MNLNKFFLTFIALLMGILIAPPFVFANDASKEKAKELLVWQLEAIKDDDYKRFVQNGNKAFKEFYDEWHYDSVKLMDRDKILKGYQLEYLGTIRRLGMIEHLWKITFTGVKYETLGCVTLSHGKVVGFDLN